MESQYTHTHIMTQFLKSKLPSPEYYSRIFSNKYDTFFSLFFFIQIFHSAQIWKRMSMCMYVIDEKRQINVNIEMKKKKTEKKIIKEFLIATMILFRLLEPAYNTLQRHMKCEIIWYLFYIRCFKQNKTKKNNSFLFRFIFFERFCLLIFSISDSFLALLYTHSKYWNVQGIRRRRRGGEEKNA